MIFQQTDAEGVKGRNHHPLAGSLADHLLNPLAHLFGCFIGEGHRQNLFRRDSGFKQMGNPAGDDPGLAGARSGEQQQGAFPVDNSFSLLWIEAIEVKHRKLLKIGILRLWVGYVQTAGRVA